MKDAERPGLFVGQPMPFMQQAQEGPGCSLVPVDDGCVPVITTNRANPVRKTLAGQIVYHLPEQIPGLRIHRWTIVRTAVLRRLHLEARMLRDDLHEAREDGARRDQDVRRLQGDLRVVTARNKELSDEVTELRERMRRLRDQVARHDEAEERRAASAPRKN